MPMPIAHGLLGASLVAAVHPQPTKHYGAPLLAGAILANLPDLDFILVYAFHSRGWHRTFSHSLTMAAVMGICFALAFGRQHLREAVAYGSAFASHGILDFATTLRGGGVELLWPFWFQRVKLGLFGLSELPVNPTETSIGKSLVLELLIFAPLLLVILAVRILWSRRRPDPKQGPLAGTVQAQP